MTARTPFEDTSVSVARSQDQIRKLLRDAGAKGVAFDESWTEPPVFTVRFVWPVSSSLATVRLQVNPLPPERSSRTGWRLSPEQRERQAWRGLAHYLEGTIKAATFGLIRFEDIFLSFIETEPNGRTIGERIIPELEQGRPALPVGS